MSLFPSNKQNWHDKTKTNIASVLADEMHVAKKQQQQAGISRKPTAASFPKSGSAHQPNKHLTAGTNLDAEPTESKSTTTYQPYQIQCSIACDQGAIRRVRFTYTGTYMLTCGVDKSIKLWNPKRELLLKTYVGHGYEVCDARGSVDNALVCSGSVDKSVFLWDVVTGKSTRRFTGHLAAVNTVMFNPPSCDVIISGSLDGRVRCWDVRAKNSRDPIQEMSDAKDSIVSIAATDHEILSACLDGRVRRYDLRNQSVSEDTLPTSTTCATFTNDGACLLVSTLDSTLRLLDKTDGSLLGTYSGAHKCSDYAVECTPSHSDEYVLCGSEDGNVAVYDLLHGNILQKLQHPQAYRNNIIQSLSHHPKFSELLTAYEDKVVVWQSADAEAAVEKTGR